MAKRGLIKGFLSGQLENQISEQSATQVAKQSEKESARVRQKESRDKDVDSQISKQPNNQTIEKSEAAASEGGQDLRKPKNQIAKKSDSQTGGKSGRTVKHKEWKFKGFYISPENEIKLKEIEMRFLKTGQRMDLSDILNLAIEKLHASMDRDYN